MKPDSNTKREATDTAFFNPPTTEQILAQVRDLVAQDARELVGFVLGIGTRLLQAKRLCVHGEFMQQVKEISGLDQRTANNYMQAAHHFAGKVEIVSNLPLTLIYRLSAESTPNDFRERFVERRRRGEQVTAKALKAELDALKAKADTAEPTGKAEAFVHAQNLNDGLVPHIDLPQAETITQPSTIADRPEDRVFEAEIANILFETHRGKRAWIENAVEQLPFTSGRRIAQTLKDLHEADATPGDALDSTQHHEKEDHLG